ncbi:2899_t:CDS:2 [Entrophospora sp. SA101]|nr:2899_t:CDS:2 [Entrophospora sp. SA101]
MVNSLLAILLVVNSRSGSGHNFVFHYPKTPQRRDEIEQSIRKEDNYDFDDEEEEKEKGDDENYFDENYLLDNDTISWPYGLSDDIDTRSLKSKVEEDVEENDFNNNSSCSGCSNVNHNTDSENNEQKESFNQLFGFEPSLLANILCPKLKTTSKFQLSIDDITFVGQPPPELELCRQVDNIYNNLITKLTAALHYEQLRCGYVSKESELILSFRDYSDIRTKDDLMNIILQKSSLAKTIKQVYDAISTDSIAHVLVNDYIDLSLQIPPLVPTTFINSSDNDLHGYEYAHYPVIAPYHTLLLLEDAEELLKNMPLDANPTLVNLVQILTPTQRLADLCTLLDCSLAQIFRLAAHLIFWRKAKIIDVINVRNVYVVSPTADMNSLPIHIEYFRQHFPALDLVTILASLSTQKPYFLILISPYEKACDSEREWLNKLVINQPKETANLFERLIKYFNGKHHIEEILFRESIKPKDLGSSYFKVYDHE